MARAVSKYISSAFEAVKAKVLAQYADPSWTAGRKWLRRVGVPRLVAEAAASNASDMLHGISLSIHRNEPELDELLRDAREATNAYTRALFQADWERFDG